MPDLPTVPGGLLKAPTNEQVDSAHDTLPDVVAAVVARRYAVRDPLAGRGFAEGLEKSPAERAASHR